MPFIKGNFLLFSALKQHLGVINGSLGQYILVYTIKCRFLEYLGSISFETIDTTVELGSLVPQIDCLLKKMCRNHT
jgi:hypothetical protein